MLNDGCVVRLSARGNREDATQLTRQSPSGKREVPEESCVDGKVILYCGLTSAMAQQEEGTNVSGGICESSSHEKALLIS